ncbi:hypothetical protein DEO72_LG3g2087 [Vigna unguiculata]|uniref:Uncharacterized protein n=1 Tax=Vigna unguiculata TaxID=3917 RepID=A0A4D6LG30_VIGUN|nr:hypothetical protein DEO72_LG3g2087 [Vigna unguiculata]
MKNHCACTLLENAAPHLRRRRTSNAKRHCRISNKEDELDLPLQPTLNTLTEDKQLASSMVWWRGRSGERREKGRGAAKKKRKGVREIKP